MHPSVCVCGKGVEREWDEVPLQLQLTSVECFAHVSGFIFFNSSDSNPPNNPVELVPLPWLYWVSGRDLPTERQSWSFLVPEAMCFPLCFAACWQVFPPRPPPSFKRLPGQPLQRSQMLREQGCLTSDLTSQIIKDLCLCTGGPPVVYILPKSLMHFLVSSFIKP